MEKISYNLVFNRKKRLNKKGMALVQVEAYLNRRKIPVGWIKKLVKWQMKGCAYFWFLVT